MNSCVNSYSSVKLEEELEYTEDTFMEGDDEMVPNGEDVAK